MYKAGVYFGLPEAHYFGEETVNWLNRSKIVKIDQLSAEELMDTDYTPSSSTALRVGSAVHQKWLEDKEEFVVIENLRTKVNKELRDKVVAEGKDYLTKPEHATVQGLLLGLDRSKNCLEVKKNLIGAEITILDDDYNGIPAKIRLDGMSKDGYVIDLKTTAAELTKEGIRETFEKFGYKYQVNMYTEIAKKWAKELGVAEVKGFKFVFVSKTNNKAAVVTVDKLDQEPIKLEMIEKCSRVKDKLEKREAGIIEDEPVIELFDTPKYLKIDLENKALVLDMLSVL